MIDNTVFQDRKAAFVTLGCKLNFSETSTIGRSLFELGFRRIRVGEKADVCVINTCAVTDIAEGKGRQTIKRLIRQHPAAFVVVTGCYAQLRPEEIAKIEGVDLVLGNNEKFDINLFLDNIDKKQTAQVYHNEVEESFCPSCSSDDRTRYFLKVQDGCDYFCSYCTIPYARGRSRSGSIAETVQRAQEAASEGAKEIVLTGINTGDFGRQRGENFLHLLQALESRVQGVERYRISSIEPNLLSQEIIDFTAVSQRFAPHFHLPLQSGSNEILKLMNRRYTCELFAEKIQMIRRGMPHAFIGVDVIVGTRGETAALFEETLQFLQQLDISQLHVFSYSERAGTKALQIAHSVSPVEKKQRSEELHRLSDEKQLAFYRSQTGRKAVVLWESARKGNLMYGFTENYVRVAAPHNALWINKFQVVELASFVEESAHLALSIK